MSSSLNDSVLTIDLTGKLDISTAPELEEVLNDSLDGVNSLVLDMTDLEYVFSAGLQVILSAAKRMRERGGMKIVHASETVMEIFHVTGLTSILDIQ